MLGQILTYTSARKYRDELRPRHGLFRSREFVMKDLYTFDITKEAALETYRQVQAAYYHIFESLKIPYLVAEASSGDMGGDLSHEYHLPSPAGEDVVAICNGCGYAANDEVAESRRPPWSDVTDLRPERNENDFSIEEIGVWRGISRDRTRLINAWYPLHPPVVTDDSPGGSTAGRKVSIHAVRSVIPDLDASVEDPLAMWQEALTRPRGTAKLVPSEAEILNLVDCRLPTSFKKTLQQRPDPDALLPDGLASPACVDHSVISESNGHLLNLLSVENGDACPRCENGILRVRRALELGHTFYLGTRYSEPLGLNTMAPPSQVSQLDQPNNAVVAVQMGCYGIGISRIIGAVAEHLVDEQGLHWPRAIAPWEVVIISSDPSLINSVLMVYDALASYRPIDYGRTIDCVLDDRPETMIRKIKDADLIGYPVMVIIGKAWTKDKLCEVQCRRLAVKDDVSLARLPQFVADLLAKL
jgi:prolyl-tRNA synthetase